MSFFVLPLAIEEDTTKMLYCAHLLLDDHLSYIQFLFVVLFRILNFALTSRLVRSQLMEEIDSAV